MMLCRRSGILTLSPCAYLTLVASQTLSTCAYRAFVASQVGSQRICGTASSDFPMPQMRMGPQQADGLAAAQLASASEQDLAIALATLRMNQAAGAGNHSLGAPPLSAVNWTLL